MLKKPVWLLVTPPLVRSMSGLTGWPSALSRSPWRNISCASVEQIQEKYGAFVWGIYIMECERIPHSIYPDQVEGRRTVPTYG